MSDRETLQQRLEEALNIAPISEGKSFDIVPKETFDKNSNVSKELEYTKLTQKELYDKGFEAMSELIDLAKETSDEKYFKALASVLDSMSKISKNVIEASKIQSEIDKNNADIELTKSKISGEDVQTKTLTQNNQQNIYVGNTKDLLEMINSGKFDFDDVGNVIENNVEQ